MSRDLDSFDGDAFGETLRSYVSVARRSARSRRRFSPRKTTRPANSREKRHVASVEKVGGRVGKGASGLIGGARAQSKIVVGRRSSNCEILIMAVDSREDCERRARAACDIKLESMVVKRAPRKACVKLFTRRTLNAAILHNALHAPVTSRGLPFCRPFIFSCVQKRRRDASPRVAADRCQREYSAATSLNISRARSEGQGNVRARKQLGRHIAVRVSAQTVYLG